MKKGRIGFAASKVHQHGYKLPNSFNPSEDHDFSTGYLTHQLLDSFS